jgi:L-alanine-DL-glutamate epimerase-like enolase superfamily enzyme
MVRIETDAGLVGWDEGFGYGVAPATKHVIDQMIAPLLIGKELQDLAAISTELQLRLSLFGRFGITIFALFGVDIALWDLVLKGAGQSLADYLGGVKQTKLRAYASLVRCGDVATAEKFTRQALEDGFTSI